MAPLIWSRKRKSNQPAYVVYSDVMQLISGSDSASKAYRKKLFGSDLVHASPDSYNDMIMLMEMGISVISWERDYTIYQKAKIIAARALKNMIALVEAHYKEMDEAVQRASKQSRSQFS